MPSIIALTLVASFLADQPYDPLRRIEAPIRHIELMVADDERRREIPLRVYLPAVDVSCPVILFSHGLGGSCRNNPYLGEHWASRGYVAVFMQHPGSDESVWRDVRPAQRMAAMRDAASASNFLLRVKDVPAVLDQLAKWNAEPAHALAGRLDLDRVGMSGHSFGARTTQAVSGQTEAIGGSFTDPRIKAAAPMSPSAPQRLRAGAADRAFANVRIPWLVMTGTNDTAPIGDQTVESRLAVFPALPPGHKYELVLDRAEHSAFGEGRLPGDRERRNPNHHRAILATSTAFWDAHLRGDERAKAWLESDDAKTGVRSVLEPADRWQRK